MVHAGNKLGCYIKPDAGHVAITPVNLRLWALNLRHGEDGITEKNPPPNHLFDNVIRNTKARVTFSLPSETNETHASGSILSPTVTEFPTPPAPPAVTQIPPQIPPHIPPQMPPHIPPQMPPHIPPQMPPQMPVQIPPGFYGNAAFPPTFYPAYPGPGPQTGFPNYGGANMSQNAQPIHPLRQELLQLPLSIFLSRLEELYPMHEFLTFQEDFEINGITPDLIPAMSDADLDNVLGKNGMGMRIVLRRLLGRDSGC
jgi:hypothetical protein